MSDQENNGHPMFDNDQNKRHNNLVESGAFDQQPHKLAEADKKANKKRDQKEARERAKKERADAIVSLAKKHDQSIAGIKLLLSQMKMQPVEVLDQKLESEKRIKDLEVELRVTEELYSELLMKVDQMTEGVLHTKRMTVKEFNREMNISMDDAASMLVRLPTNGKFYSELLKKEEVMEE